MKLMLFNMISRLILTGQQNVSVGAIYPEILLITLITLQEHDDDSKKIYDEKAAKNCPSYLIWSIFTRRREMQIVHSLEGRKGNSQGRPGVLGSTQGTN